MSEKLGQPKTNLTTQLSLIQKHISTIESQALQDKDKDDPVEADDTLSYGIETNQFSVLIFLKKGGEDEIVTSMNKFVKHIIKKQEQKQRSIVCTIYLEKWAIKMLWPKFSKQQYTKFKIWPSDSRKGVYFQEKMPAIDYAFTIGGDGTILTLLRMLQTQHNTQPLTPIIPFTMGSLSYLCNFDIKDFKAVIDASLMERNSFDDLSLDYRMQLQVSLGVIKENEKEHEYETQINNGFSSPIQNNEFYALNEVTVTRGQAEWMVQFEVYINECLLTIVQGDGVLISTPTGSTAYNLSCGGSIVHYSAQVVCLTPICPHSLSFRPIILPADVDIKIKVPISSRTSAWVTIDGHTKIDVQQGDYLKIKLAPFFVPFARWSQENRDRIWSKKLYKHLKWNKQIIQKPLKNVVIVKPKL